MSSMISARITNRYGVPSFVMSSLIPGNTTYEHMQHTHLQRIQAIQDTRYTYPYNTILS